MSLFDPEPSARPADPTPEDSPAAPEGPLVRVRLTVAYDGSGFHGFAAQPGCETVAGRLGDAIAKVAGHPVKLTCAGRTDAGVHAWGQVVHTDLAPARRLSRRRATGEGRPGALDLDGLVTSCNKMLAPSIVVRSAQTAPAGFDARRSARSRLYRYTVLNAPVPDPFLAATSWHVEDPLDLRAMRAATDPVIGEHDFSAFCRRPRGDEAASLVRRVLDAGWTDLGSDVLRFQVEATSFCHQMVRSLVGTMVEMGRGRRSPGDMAWVVRSADRSLAASPAPPHGLCLWSVSYPPDDQL